jgi:hypothetical protein
MRACDESGYDCECVDGMVKDSYLDRLLAQCMVGLLDDFVNAGFVRDFRRMIEVCRHT